MIKPSPETLESEKDRANIGGRVSVLACFDHEASKKRLTTSSNLPVNERDQRQCGDSEMEYGLEQVSLDALMLLQEIAASGRADTAALIAKFRPERQRARRLSEYCDEIFAKIRVA
jgi:hypothetical protein